MIFSKALAQRLVAARKYMLAVGVTVVACVTPLYAQEQRLTAPKFEGKVVFGTAVFGEDLQHNVVGVATRVYVTKRLSIEPEYLYMRRSKDDQDHVFQPNVVFDFTDPAKRIVPYVIGGVGVLHNEGRVLRGDFETRTTRVEEIRFTTWTASVGVGAKIRFTNKLFVSPEVRIGREPTARATISVGYVFGGSR